VSSEQEQVALLLSKSYQTLPISSQVDGLSSHMRLGQTLGEYGEH